MFVPASHTMVPRGLLPLRFPVSAIAGSNPFSLAPRNEADFFLKER